MDYRLDSYIVLGKMDWCHKYRFDLFYWNSTCCFMFLYNSTPVVIKVTDLTLYNGLFSNLLFTVS